MLEKDLKEAVYEAQKFIERAEAVGFRKRYSDDALCVDHSKESSALRRQSMELTRALSKLRNSN